MSATHDIVDARSRSGSLARVPGPGSPDREILRLGGAFAVIGGLGYFVTLLFHGDLPDQTAATALDHIAGRPEWGLLKLALIASIMAWIGAFIALTVSFTHGASWLLSRMSLACLLVGAAVVLVEYSILGHEIAQRAEVWQAASGLERQRELLIGETLLGVTSGLFLSFIAWLLGLPYLLMGLAVALGGVYPRWLGWAAVVAGSGALLAGTTRFLGFELVPFPVIYGAFIIPLTLWLTVIGVLMWKPSRTRP